MLIPCIDLQKGKAVQLVHGRKRELAVADVMSLLLKFKNYKWLHVIDLDAGDDPDVTDGCQVVVSVAWAESPGGSAAARSMACCSCGGTVRPKR